MSFLSPMTAQPNGTSASDSPSNPHAAPNNSHAATNGNISHANTTTGNTTAAPRGVRDPSHRHSSIPSHVVIVGGSLAGLFTGTALKTHGVRTTILERNPSRILENQGAGIIAGGDTIRFFKKYDRFGREVAVPSKGRIYLDEVGKVVHEEEMDQHMTSWDLCYYVLRANYDGLESGYVDFKGEGGIGRGKGEKEGDGEIDYRYGCTVTDISVEGEKVKVSYERSTGEKETVEADMVVGADGPSSTVRKLVCPGIERTYAGYVVLRGTVPESEASDEAKQVFVERFAFHHQKGNQNLTYTIPGKDGTLEQGKRLMNFVWYTNFDEGSPELEELMTDVDGKLHRITVSPGKMKPEQWDKMKIRARKMLPPQMAEMVEKTTKPIVQAITDVISPTNFYHDGKVVLVGDALAGFRPHTVASTSQAAYDVMVLADWLEGKLTDEEFRRDTMKVARKGQTRGVRLGTRSQFEVHSLKEYVEDRNEASTKRENQTYEDWMLEE